jgi:putative transposase
VHTKEITPMALDESAVSELLDALTTGEGTDLVRELAQWALQQLIEVEATAKIGADPWARTDGRTTHRNGHRPRVLSTKAGDLQVGIPKLRKGSFFPELLEPRRRIDQALYAVVMEAYVNGVSTRSVDDLVAAMGVDTGISKSEVSRICAGLDEGSTRSGTARWATSRSRMCIWTPPTSTFATTPWARSCPGRS